MFKHRHDAVYLVADAYRGDAIRQTTVDFFAAAGGSPEPITLPPASKAVTLTAGGGSNLVAYVGHDGLMGFRLATMPRKRNEAQRDAIVLACASKRYLAQPLKASGAYPLLSTTGLMAYTLKSALPAPTTSTGSAACAAYRYDSHPVGRY